MLLPSPLAGRRFGRRLVCMGRDAIVSDETITIEARRAKAAGRSCAPASAWLQPPGRPGDASASSTSAPTAPSRGCRPSTWPPSAPRRLSAAARTTPWPRASSTSATSSHAGGGSRRVGGHHAWPPGLLSRRRPEVVAYSSTATCSRAWPATGSAPSTHRSAGPTSCPRTSWPVTTPASRPRWLKASPASRRSASFPMGGSRWPQSVWAALIGHRQARLRRAHIVLLPPSCIGQFRRAATIMHPLALEAGLLPQLRVIPGCRGRKRRILAEARDQAKLLRTGQA